MSDIPQYERHTKISPGSPTQGFEQAGAQLGAATKAIGDWGSQVAQNAAFEDARQKGIEAGKTPGRKLFPALTQTDQEFVKVYKQEEYNNLMYEGNKGLSNLYSSAKKDVTSNSVKAYEESGRKTIDDLINLATPENRPNLERSLNSSYEASHLSLIENLYAKDKAYQENLSAAQFDQSLDNITNNGLQGNIGASFKEYEATKDFIIGKAATREWSPTQIQKANELVDDRYQAGLYMGLASEALEGKTYESFIDDLQRHKPDDLTPIQHQKVVSNVMAYGNQYRAAVSGQQYLESNKANMEVQAGTMTPSKLEYFRETLEPHQFADLEMSMAKEMAKQGNLVNLSNDMISKFSDPAAMSHFTDAQTDQVFEAIVRTQEAGISESTGENYQASLIDKASIAQDIKHSIPSLVKELSQAANFGNAAQASEALRAMTMLNRNNPAAMSTLDKKTEGMLLTFGDLLANTTADAEESLKTARGDINVDENTKVSRLNAWKDYQKINSAYADRGSKLKNIAKNIGASSGWLWKTGEPTRMDPGLDIAFDRLMAAFVPMVPNIKNAEKMAFDEMAKTNRPTLTNNRDQIMKLPPELFYPGKEEFLQEDKAIALQKLCEANNKSSFAYNKLEFVGYKKGDLYAKVDGVERRIEIASDIDTQWGADQRPSWQFNYVDEQSVPYPIMDMNKGMVARWYVDESRFPKPMSKAEYEKQQFEAAKKEHEQQLKLEEINAQIFLDGGP